jgi:chromosome segregation ATPase
MDKNNNKNLVTRVDEDPTAELEILSHSLQMQTADDELESDANTYNCTDESDASDASPRDIEVLRRGIGERDEYISRLQFDIEQLRSRWTGLDKEIKVREKLTDNVNAELRKAKNELATTQRKLRDSETAQEQLTARVGDIESAIELTAKLIESLHRTSELRDRRVAELEQQADLYEQELGALRDQREALHAESEVRHLEQEAREARIHEISLTLQEANSRIDALVTEQAGMDAALAGKTAETESVKQQLAQSRDDLAALKEALADTPAVTGGESGDPIAENTLLTPVQAGALANDRQEVHDLQAQVSRTEAYADSLRIKLQTQTRFAEDETCARKRTDIALADARRQIAGRSQSLESEKRLTANLREQIDELKSGLEAEISSIRFELGAAQQSIADQELIHEQLTADLFDSQSFRQVLESQLETTEESSAALIRSLRHKIKRLEHEHEDDRHKLSNKDGAIAALLNELANRSSAANVAGMAEVSGNNETEYLLDSRQDEKSVSDRITRLLVGNVDGQELRFPLFKDKLTIGRTKNNDIHLKAPYISRRHALIVTENERTKIIDWGSKNGIAVNNRAVTEQVLKSGDIVTIGNADFRYEERPKR